MRTTRWILAALAIAAGSCGGAQRECVDEEALRAQIRAEVLAELRDNRRVAADRVAEPREDAANEPLPGDDAPRVRVPLGDGPRRGAAEPLVTIVMFSDLQCPFCARVEPTLARLLDEHGADLQIVWRNNPLPFHQNAMPAAEAAMEAFDQGGSDLFFRFVALVFENQQAMSRADLERYASQLGMDLADLARALDDHTHQAAIAEDQALAARVGARGTPGFFLNGRQLMGAQPYEEFDRVVREEIALARRDLARGARRADLYDRRMEHAAEAPEPEPERPREPRRVPDPSAVYRVPIDGRPARGRSDALVTIVMFSDFQCPFCARVLPTLRQIEDRYGREVRIVYRHNPLPFHENALPAAIAAEEVFRQRGAQAFFRYHDLLFENQQDLGRDRLIELARRVRASPREVERALDEQRHRAEIQADQDLAVSLGASGTPSFFVNGRNVRGAQPFEAFARVIDEELARARARLDAGTPRRRLYEETIANGATSPQLVDEGPAAAPSAPPDADRVYTIPVPRRAPTRGPANARVTIQIFSDFQCPFCNRVRPTVEQILERYPTEVRLVWRDYPLPFHQNAMPAAEAAREVFRQRGNDAFWRYNELLFENQQSLDVDSLVRLAGQIPGVNTARVRRALERHTHREAVQADMQAVQDAGARIGTPSFFINGRLLQGAQPFPAFEAAIDRELGRSP